jgi:hypothetical protein
MSENILSVLITVAMTFGVVYWTDWINRKRIEWNMKRNKANQPDGDWDYIKYILRRHNR